MGRELWYTVEFSFPLVVSFRRYRPSYTQVPSWYRSSISNAFVFHFPLSFSPHISLDQLSLNTQFFFWIRTRSHLYRRTMQCTFRYHVCDTYGRERTWTENNGILIDKKKRKSIIGDMILIFFSDFCLIEYFEIYIDQWEISWNVAFDESKDLGRE